ncbi:MAG: polysaccharide deacetylase family protein, partial [Anaerolineaceae bacterium]|nr:polysaccharide deacetylase family protein [Anaerolineaceae bacterium]
MQNGENHSISRRDFLKRMAALGLGAAALTACQQVQASTKIQMRLSTRTLTPEITGIPATSTPHPTLQPTQMFSPAQLPELLTPAEIDFMAVHEIWSGNEERPVVMMTYDDSGTEEQIDQILEAYRKVQGKATFFFLGDKLKNCARSIERIASSGHLIGCHAYSHETPLTLLSAEEVEWQFHQFYDVMGEILPGYRVRYFRAPFGANDDNVRRIAANWGMQSVRWGLPSDGISPKTYQ